MVLNYVPSQKGKLHLVHDGHRFIKEKMTKTKVIWKCIEYKIAQCKARVHTSNDGVIAYVDAHNHAPKIAQIKRKEVLSEIKQKAKTTQETSYFIFATVTQPLSNAIIGTLPRSDAVKKMIRRKRNEDFGSLGNPKNIEELNIPAQFTRTFNGQKFLQYDSGPSQNRILIFAAEKNLNILNQAKHIFADGTFKTCPAVFFQLFTVHAEFQGSVVPVALILLPNKLENSYVRALESLRGLVAHLIPDTITTDYEVGLINACRQVFPTTRAKGCYFHFSQCIWRRIQLIPEASALYKSNATFALNLKLLGALAFVPVADVPAAFEAIQDMDFFTENVFLRPLLDYMEDTWIGRLQQRGNRRQPSFPMGLWNVYLATLNNEARTNNSLEGWHRRFSSLLGAFHPTFWKFVGALKTEQTSIKVKIEQLLAGQLPPTKLRAYRECASRLLRVTQGYADVSILDYLRGVGHNIEFNV